MADIATKIPLATTTLSSSQSSVTFSSINGSYTDLVLVATGTATTSTGANVQFNSDTASNYSVTRLLGDASSASSNRSTTQTSITVCYNGNWTTTSTANFIVHINNYSNSSTYKTLLSRGSRGDSGADAIVGLWRSTTAITSLTFNTAAGSFASGSTFTLYGIL